MVDEYGGDARIRGVRRLWRLVGPGVEHEHVDPGDLGQYAATLHRAGPGSAGREFRAVREHLASGCERCERDLCELLVFLREQ
jgi:hypothetical protein